MVRRTSGGVRPARQVPQAEAPGFRSLWHPSGMCWVEL